MGDCGQRLLWGLLNLSPKLMSSGIYPTARERKRQRQREKDFLNPTLPFTFSCVGGISTYSDNYYPVLLELAVVSLLELVNNAVMK